MIENPISNYLIFSILLFTISVCGMIIKRKNIIALLMCLELIFLAVNTNFIGFARFWLDMSGQVFVFFILTVTAAESAVGLAMLIFIFKKRNTINIEDFNNLNG